MRDKKFRFNVGQKVELPDGRKGNLDKYVEGTEGKYGYVKTGEEQVLVALDDLKKLIG